MSNSYNTNKIFKDKEFWAHWYSDFRLEVRNLPDGYPRWTPRKIPSKWLKREITRYWNSERNKAKRVMERHETPEPSRPRRGERWNST
jgi:hypothetical protein